MKLKSISLNALVVLTLTFAQGHIMYAEESFVGPLLVTETEDEIILQDVGTNRVWNREISIYTNLSSQIWTPEGCNIVLEEWDTSENDWRYSLLSITTLELTELPITGTPIWSPNGEYLAYASSEDDTNTTIYIADSSGESREPILHTNGWTLSFDGYPTTNYFTFQME